MKVMIPGVDGSASSLLVALMEIFTDFDASANPGVLSPNPRWAEKSPEISPFRLRHVSMRSQLMRNV